MPCPSDDTLVAMLEHALPPAAFADLEQHISSCEHCRRVVAAAATADGVHQQLAEGTPPPAPVDVAIAGGTLAGRYTIDGLIGRGGMGTVYLATDRSLGREVALKVHRAGSGGDRLHREAIAMAKLSHPNVVTVFEVTSVDDRLCVAMEYVRGDTLRGHLARRARSWREIVDLLLGAGEGLAAAHDAGLVHRDFKPDNVLVGSDGRPKVGDFGLARVGSQVDTPPELKQLVSPSTETGTVLGTPAYMAPEQLAGELVDARADQFAFCVVAWECLYGKRPFGGTTLAALKESIERGELPAPSRKDVPDRVRAAIAHGLADEPSERYADMRALLAALRAAARPRTKRYAAIAAGAAIVLGTTGVVGAGAWRDHRHSVACDDEGEAIRGKLSPLDRGLIRGAFLATSVPNAASSFERTADVLARTTDTLAAQAVATCRGRAEPTQVTLARQACLTAKTSELTALVELLDHADAKTVQNAPNAAWALYSPKPCDDPRVLLASTSPVAPRTPELVARLGRVRALECSGRYREGSTLASTLLDDARARGDQALELDATEELAKLREQFAPPPEAQKLFDRVIALAEAQGRDLDAVIALDGLANLSGVVLHDHAAAHRYVELARAKLARLGGDNVAISGILLVVEGQILWDENRLGEAEAAMRNGAADIEQAFGADHPKLGSTLGNLSEILRAQGKFAEGLATAKRTLEILEKAYGPEHPTVAGSEMNLASALIDVKQFSEARERLQRADAVFVRVFGENHPTRAAIYGNLGALESAEHHWDAALVAFRTAAAVLEHLHDMQGAAAAHGDIARTCSLAGRHDEAVSEQERAVAMYEQLGEEGANRLAPALADLSDIHIARGRADLALPIAERAVKLAAARPSDANPEDLADARMSLAAALWDTNTDRVRARQLAEQAHAAYTDPDRVARAATWLNDHAK